jgi:hypothetical protein
MNSLPFAERFQVLANHDAGRSNNFGNAAMTHKQPRMVGVLHDMHELNKFHLAHFARRDVQAKPSAETLFPKPDKTMS